MIRIALLTTIPIIIIAPSMRDAEGVQTGCTDGIHLDHAPYTSECEGDRHGEKSRQKDSESAGKGFSDVVDRSASDRSVRHDDLGLLGEHRFSVDRCHRKEGDHPHPEDRPGSSDQDRPRRAYDVAGPDLRRDRSHQRLERTDPRLPLHPFEFAQRIAQSFAETADLDEAGADGKKTPQPISSTVST